MAGRSGGPRRLRPGRRPGPPLVSTRRPRAARRARTGPRGATHPARPVGRDPRTSGAPAHPRATRRARPPGGCTGARWRDPGRGPRHRRGADRRPGRARPRADRALAQAFNQLLATRGGVSDFAANALRTLRTSVWRAPAPAATCAIDHGGTGWATVQVANARQVRDGLHGQGISPGDIDRFLDGDGRPRHHRRFQGADQRQGGALVPRPTGRSLPPAGAGPRVEGGVLDRPLGEGSRTWPAPRCRPTDKEVVT